MLQEWSVTGFKSIRSAPALSLTKINVFAGANSSGKSSLLQSILLLKQTLQYGAPNRPLSLNGPILRLGTFDDVIFASADEKEVALGFRFDLRERVTGPPWMTILNRGGAWTSSETGAVSAVHGQFKWAPGMVTASKSHTAVRLQSVLTAGNFSVERAKADGETQKFSAEYRPRAGPSDWYNVSLDSISKAEIFDNRADAQVTSLYVTHFLPSWVQIKFNAGKERAHKIAEAVFSTSGLLRTTSPLIKELVPTPALAIINEWLAAGDEPQFALDGETFVSDVNQRLQPFLLRRARIAGQSDQANLFATRQIELRGLQESVEIALTAEAEKLPAEWSTDLERPRTLLQGAEFLTSYFKFGVRYLGPLRDEPRPVYPLEALENTTDVGYRGEHTAAVLELNANTNIQYISSVSFKADKPVFTVTSTTLRQAVVDWLGYMGVAEDVVAREEGVFGNRLQVTTQGLEKFHDLTNVGVGVSQVLPIVVSALLAPVTSLLIFEQPELHLHPRVQARLADFFLAIAMSGRQCILETHSEYLIERFRRRIAESDDENLEQVLAIYFAERESGETSFRPIAISKFGAITDWPKDFFDQSQIETTRILEAAAKKRAKEKAKGQS